MATAAELMARAKQLMEQAKKIEEGNALKIGKHVLANIDTLTISDLKKFILEVTGEPREEKHVSKKTQKRENDVVEVV